MRSCASTVDQAGAAFAARKIEHVRSRRHRPPEPSSSCTSCSAASSNPWTASSSPIIEALDIIGIYPNYAEAHKAWKAAAQRSVDNAHMRYFIVHMHRLLDPETAKPKPRA